ncbi:SMP-30/gluconolactonase/LRE family protein [Leucobacter aridicollis]|uniref:Sugar lactone lactonase YvrE n=1 Tax=Leucobacter aridicollis TaxID=283878 RepID=A0A852RFE0_9MICO|nr:SMP-30/gluconolactonase/LRE family protein [Leucobacter aridicollis]NYD28076.1 sugar lactone lactonase YvrE [Leucobacter aridicollis]
MEARQVFAAGAELGEGPVWHDGSLYWVDIPNGRLHRSDAEGTALVHEANGTLSKALPCDNGGFALLLNDRIEFHDSAWNLVRSVRVLPEDSDMRLSDGTVGAGGEIWFGTMRRDMQPGGSLWRLRPIDSAPTECVTGVGMPNGIAFSPDLSTLYFVDSHEGTISSFEYDPVHHTVGQGRVLVSIDDGPPDGISVDAAGSIWVALWSQGCLRRLELDGSWSQEILLPCRNVTSCEFGGDSLQTLYITSATAALDAQQRREQPQAGSVFGITLPVGGITARKARVK